MKIEDFTPEVQGWLKRFIAKQSRRASQPDHPIDATANVGPLWGVRSQNKASNAPEPNTYVLRPDGDGGSVWAPSGFRSLVDQILDHVGTDLVAYWRMGEGFGNEKDYSQYSVGGKSPKDLVPTTGTTNGTYDVTGGLVPALDDGAFRFNYNQAVSDGGALGEYFSVADTGTPRWAFAGTLSFTIECLFKPTSGWLLPATGFTAAGIVGTAQGNGGTSVEGWGLHRERGDGIIFGRGDGSGNRDLVSSSAISSDVWHHLAATYDGTTMKLYIDGLFVGSTTSSVSQTNKATIRVGMTEENGTFAAIWEKYTYGTVDEVAVYSTALTAAEILLHAGGTNIPNAPTSGDIAIYLEGSSQHLTQGINFKAGTRATITTAVNATLDAVDVTIDATAPSAPSLAAVLAVGHDANSIEITNGATPTTSSSLATKAYVDAVAQGLSIKQSCRLATATALPAVTLVGSTLVAVSVGALTVDGVATALNDRILVKDQAAGAQNGIYTVTTLGTGIVAFILTRATDSDTSAEIVGGFTFIEEGTANAASGFVNTNSGTITVGTTAITYTQFSGAGEITAGAALTKTGNTLDVAVDNATIEVNADALRVKAGGIGATELASTAVTPTTYGDSTHVGQFTVDADGRLTAAAAVAISGVAPGTAAVATDSIWDAKGDTVAGTGADAAVRVAVGANGASYVADSTQTAGLKWEQRAGADGWIDDSANTWTYASASTFTMSGDRTATFQKGTRLRFTQTTVKYGTVALSSFASSTTTVTIIVNTDHVLANAAISVNSYSQAASPDGYPSLFAYSSTQTGFSGTPTVTAKFAVFGRVCHVFIQVDGTSNNAAWTWALPVTSLQAEYLACVSYSVATFASGRAAIGGGSSTVTMGIGAGADGGYTASQGKGGYMALTVAF